MEAVMRRVSELYGRYPGSDIYVVGTGASMRVFPTRFLADKITIGLNMAWKLLPMKYCITIRPELNVPEFMGEPPHPEITWIIKDYKLTTPEQKRYVAAHPDRFYHFETKGQPNPLPPDQPSIAGRIADWVRKPTGDFLYLWSSISQSGVNLAANMGAKNIFLVGCDNCALQGNHHAHQQHTFWKGADPRERYEQYELGLVEVRSALFDRGVNLLNLTPFVSLENPGRDFERLCRELRVPELIENVDITDRSAAGGTGSQAAPTAPPAAAPQGLAHKLKTTLTAAFRRTG
jgi:hypothetical protein